MLIDPSAVVSAAQQQGGASSSLSQLSEDYQAFLTLLTAQVQYQDPLEPVDGTEFVAQLAQLTQVEQSVRSNDQLETLTAQLTGAINVAGADFLGRNAQVDSNQIVLGANGGEAHYQLAGDAASVKADIIDPLGRVVRTIESLPTAGGERHTLTWDGLDNAGVSQLEGSYTVAITAIDTADTRVGVTQNRSAEVSEVLFSGGLLQFRLADGELVSSAQIQSVR